MRLTIGPFRGAFARRLFLRFLLAAFVPVVAVAVLAWFNTSRVVAQQAAQRLANDSQNQGLDIFSRLKVAEALLIRIAEDSAARGHTENGVPAFEAVALYSDGERRMLYGDARLLPVSFAEESPSSLAKTPPRTRLIAQPLNKGGMVMLRALTTVDGRPRMVAGRLDPDYVIGNADRWPNDTRFCVVEQQTQRMLDCPNLQSVYDERIQGGAITLTAPGRIPVDGEDTLVAYWDVFIPSHFDGVSWRVIGFKPWAAAAQPAVTFYRLLPFVVLLSLIAAGMLGMSQIRRVSDPLRRLRAGVQRIAEGEFATRVEIDSSDEFEELGDAFNTMAKRLGTQFHTLDVLAATDRGILTSAGAETVVENMLQSLHRIMQADVAAILLFDPDLPQVAHLHVVELARPEHVKSYRVQPGATEREALDRHERLLYLDDDALAELSYTQQLRDLNIDRVTVAPVREHGRLWAALFAGYRGTDTSAEDEQQALAVADRLAVALAASGREKELYRQAHYDGLTGLPNRQLFIDRLEHQIALAAGVEQALALMFIDLDHFKNVNDSVGHSAGDALLVEAAQRFADALDDMDTVARWGGDEFVVLLPRADDVAALDRCARRLIDRLSETYVINGLEHRVSASIGLALYPADGRDAEALLAHADAAMYQAKDGGRGRHVFFEKRMNERIRERVQIEAELRHAIDNEELFLQFQPLVRMDNGGLGAVEALVRWRHPERGIVPPGLFIPALESSGLIVAAGAWILRQACHQYLHAFPASARPERIAVNVSPKQFWTEDFVEMVQRTLVQTGLPGERLELEITENLLLTDMATASARIRELNALGVRMSMDDFGTGYSSFSYLRQLPVQTVKIDRCFVDGIETPGSDAAIVMRSLIDMLHGLGKTVVVEGIETAEQLDLLNRYGCDLAQGFYLSRPVSPDEVGAYLRP